MSIDQMIQQRVEEGRLHPFLPMPASARRYRRMFLTDELRRELDAAEGDNIKRFAELEADLAQFVQSPTLDPKYLFLLSPTRDSVWEIRSGRPDPSIRVFVMFAGKDQLIAMHLERRADLGGWETEAWKVAKRRALAMWRNLIPAYDPISETDATKIVTGAIDGKYFRSRAPV